MSKQFSNSKFTHKIKWERKLVQAKNVILKKARSTVATWRKITLSSQKSHHELRRDGNFTSIMYLWGGGIIGSSSRGSIIFRIY